jgi:hypothetical protein
MHMQQIITKSTALRFVLLIGIVNLFADLTYEGARSINGQFLGTLGASALVVGSVAGFGEFVGYALRSVSGFFADTSHRYWVLCIFVMWYLAIDVAKQCFSCKRENEKNKRVFVAYKQGSHAKAA